MTSTGKERRHFTLEKHRQSEMRLAGVVEFRVGTSSHSSLSKCFQVSLHQMSWTGSCIMPCIPVLCQSWR